MYSSDSNSTLATPEQEDLGADEEGGRGSVPQAGYLELKDSAGHAEMAVVSAEEVTMDYDNGYTGQRESGAEQCRETFLLSLVLFQFPLCLQGRAPYSTIGVFYRFESVTRT